MNHYVNEDTVTHDIYTNTIVVKANECVIDFLSDSSLLEIVEKKYATSIRGDFCVSVEAIECHISEIYLPNIPIKKFVLNGSIVKGPVNCYGTQFIGSIYCLGTVFQDEVVLLASSLSGDATFNYSVFDSELDLTLAEGRNISFVHTKFNDIVYLDELFFEENINFCDAFFKYSFCLLNSVVKKEVSLKGTQIDCKCIIEGVVTKRIDFTKIRSMNRMEIRKIKGYEGNVVLQFDEERYITILDNNSILEERSSFQVKGEI